MSIVNRALNYVNRNIKFNVRIRDARDLGISFYKPNYIYLNKMNSESIVVDVGCASHPDFSIHIINTHNAKCFGIDPTRKHFSSLEKVEKEYAGKFKHLPIAIGASQGKMTFFESKKNDSGSLLKDHSNVLNDETISYEVEVVGLKKLKNDLNVSKIDILKLDLEGAEYQLIENLKSDDLEGIEQLFIEFHHHCIEKYSTKDTLKLVHKIKDFGYQFFTLDDHNYLFYR